MTPNKAIGEQLVGLRIELQWNRQTLEVFSPCVREYLDTDGVTVLPIDRLRTAATSHYLMRPSLSDRIDTDLVSYYLYAIDTKINDVLTGIGRTRIKENKMQLAEKVILAIGDAERMSDGLEVAIDTILKNLGPLLPL